MRRRSLIGPLLLMLIGAFFLLRNIHPEWASFEIIASYWPFLLIAWGLIRLLEILFWRLTSKPLPSRGISGGEWTLIVFLCLIGSGLFFLHGRVSRLPPLFVGDRSLEFFGEPFDYSVPEQRQAVKVTRVVIENQRGNTRVVGGDTGEIKVGGRKTIRAFRQPQADAADRQTPVEIIAQGGQILVRTNQEKVSGDLRVSTDLELTVPRGVSIQASGRSGDFDILNVEGGVEVSSTTAGVRLQDIGGNVRVDLRRGSIVRAVNVKGSVEVLGRGDDVELENVGGDVTINGYYSGDIQCRNLAKPMLFQSGTTELRIGRLPGQLHMDLGDLSLNNVEGPVKLTAKSKDLRIEDMQGALEISLDRGDVTLLPKRALTGKIDVTTRGGNVELAVPADARFELEGVTHRGGIENEFGAPLQVSSDGPRISVKGSTGKGAQITLRTDRGQIKIRKQ
jgi:DUF4097 and DUF4098 domain-containing protein YvlB